MASETVSHLESLTLSYDHYLKTNEDLRKNVPNYDIKGHLSGAGDLGLALISTPY